MLAIADFYLVALVATLFALPTQANYTLSDSFEGSTFFDTFDFFTETDPTKGFVKYVDSDTATKNELIGLVNGSDISSSVYLGADFKSVTSAGRESVRIQSQQSWTHGLLIADVQVSPSGCGSWPALWLLSHAPTWPGSNGEIDILEGVNNQVANAMTLHTSAGCTIQNSTTAFSGTLTTSNCDVNDPNQPTNAGCSILAPVNDTIAIGSNTSHSHSTAGPAFNSQGGGVYAMLWTSEAITFWFYPRGFVPSDITANTPDPNTWTAKPIAHFEGCDLDAHLKDLSIVINLTFCGAYAGPAFISGGCAASTGVGTCDEFVGQHPGAFKDAYWLLNSIKMYQNESSSSSSSSASVKRDGGVGKKQLNIPTIDLLERRSLPLDSTTASNNGEAHVYHPPQLQRQTSGASISLHAGIEQEGAYVTRGLAIFGVFVAIFFAALG